MKATNRTSGIRILYVTSYYKPAYVYGGPVQSISAICEALVKIGAQVTVFTTNANGPSRLDVPLREPVNVGGVTVWYYPTALNGFFYYAPDLPSVLSSHISEFDIAVLEALWTYPLGPSVRACNRDHIPYILPLRGQLFPWALRHKRWRKRIYMALFGKRYINGAAAIHCVDLIEAEAVLQLGLNPPIFVVPNGIEVSRFNCMPERGHLRERLGISKEAVLLLFLGRLNRIKRPDIAVQALAATKSLALDVHLLLAGPDEERLTPMLQAQAENLGCVDRLHMTDLLPPDGVLQAFADTDLLLMPSEIQESFGMSALEAMAAGVPILVSEGIPVGHWAEKEGAGRMVSCTTEAFAKATIELLSNPSKLGDMGECGRELAKQRFDISVVAHQMLAQYKSIVTNGYPLQDVRENVEDI